MSNTIGNLETTPILEANQTKKEYYGVAAAARLLRGSAFFDCVRDGAPAQLSIFCAKNGVQAPG
jgi:hypothetical protein